MTSRPRSTNIRVNNPYSCWKTYFNEKDFNKDSPLLKKIRAVEKFLEHEELIAEESIFNVDINIFEKNVTFLNDWPDFISDLRENPKETLNCLRLAMHKVKEDKIKNSYNFNGEIPCIPYIKIKLINYNHKLSLNGVKIGYYGKLVSVRGCVIRVNKVKQLITDLTLYCVKCNTTVQIKQENGIYEVHKKKCDSCGAKKYEPDLSSPQVSSIPFQVIRLQEHYGEENLDNQVSVPRVLDVELMEDLVDSCMPGDDVTVIGIIKMQGTDNGKLPKTNSTSSSLYLEAVSVVNSNNKIKNISSSIIEFNTRDYVSIKDIHNNSDTLSLLVHSLCPGIYGHEMIKMALLLTLFGGSLKHKNLRDNIHVLIVGDPGLGKSQLLQACARVASKGIYVSGNSSTSSGLTVTLIKDGSNDFALEPGALVLADRGCCCIDEFDKMPTQHQALLETMEQQSVSVAKSGVVWSLPARTSILAAANPIGGRYNKSKRICKNLNMSQPLLSRFDLVFLLLDQPNKDFDNFLCDHVMNLHKNLEKDSIAKSEYIENRINANSDSNLLKIKLVKSSKNTKIIKSTLLRKYIEYARQYVKPKLSEASAEVLQEFYMTLRRAEGRVENDIPICLRQLEAMIRLTEARAKLDLREETTKEDALEIIELFQNTVVNMKENFVSGIDPVKNSKNPMRRFLGQLQRNSEFKADKIFSKTELQDIGKSIQISLAQIPQIIDKLNEQGILIQQGNSYKFTSL